MPRTRPLWSGALSFGLVNVPVTLVSAVRDLDLRFNQLHESDGSPIETRRVCAQEGRQVQWEEIAKGYELEDGRWVLLGDEDLAAAAPKKSRAIEIDAFVDEEQIDPVYYDRPYLLAPKDESSARAYALLGQAMRRAGKVALGRFVMHAKEHLVSIRPHEELLMLTTVRFQDEVRSRAEIAEALDAAAAPVPEQVEDAVAIIEELHVPFDPTRYKDEHRAHLERIIKRKQKGQKISIPVLERESAREPVPTAPDLMGALQESLARIRGEGAGKAVKKRKKASTSTTRKPRPTRSGGSSRS